MLTAILEVQMRASECMRVSFGFLATAIVVVLCGCAQHHKDPYAEIGVSRPSLQSAMENADNETWRVLDLKLEDTDGDGAGHYSFGFNPDNRNNPFDNTCVGRVAADAVVGIAPPIHGASALQAESQIIVVRRGSLYAPPPSIELTEPGGVPAPHPAAHAPDGPTTIPVHASPHDNENPASPA